MPTQETSRVQKKSFFIYLILALLPVIILPSYVFWLLPPRFNNFIIEDTKNEATRVAHHLSSTLFEDNTTLSSKQNLDRLRESDERIRKELQLTKFKLFLPTGEAVYSSQPEEIGLMNTQDYFFNIVAKGEALSKLVRKESLSLEGQRVRSDVVETYVPIMRGDRFLGAFEIYYDITETKAKLTLLTNKIYFVLVIISVILMSVIVFSALKIKKSIEYQTQYEQTLRQLSITDELTGLLNRRGFMALAEKQKAMAERLKQLMLIVYCDVDGMKWINDNLGHDAGDEALKETAQLLYMTFREADVLCRLGGDEFAVLLTSDPLETSVENLEKRFYKNLEQINLKPERTYELKVSLGVCGHGAEASCTLGELMNRADKLMYERKQKRKKTLS